ncbi:MAG: hypothetical protein EBR82_19740 [Caulobacteraceae bacterium]|nr:hypothetical protein [Caulobacteraceae bacterium]
MKRSLAAVVALLTVAPLTAVSLSACDPKTKASDAHAEAPAAAETGTGAPAADDHAASTATSSEAPAAEGAVRIANAPDFAAVYPGGQVESPPTTADGPSGPGGLVTFKTEARPEAIIAFYKQRAEAAGLAPVMSLNQGDTVAFGAAEASNGATLQVVATAMEKAPTSVQLTWSAGQ